MKARIIPKGKINWLRILISGIIFAVIAQIVHSIGAYLAMNYYLNPAHYAVWSPLMMLMNQGSYLNQFMYHSLAFNLVTGIIFAFAYSVLRAAVPGRDVVSKGLTYGFLVFLVGSIPGYMALYLLINLPYMLLAYWAVESLIIYLISGMVVAKVNR